MVYTTRALHSSRTALALGFVLLCVPITVRAEVVSLDARITVRENASLEVAERIVYDFGSEKRHGLFRIVPYSYQAGKTTYTAKISSLTVSDAQGNPVPFVESLDNSQLNVKIGDPHAEIVGQQTYVLSYRVDGPFLYWDDGDELYWNVTGAWTTPVRDASVLVDMPAGAQVLRASCFIGRPGSTTPCVSNEELVSADRAGYHARAEQLAPGEALAISVIFPKGVITERVKPWQHDGGWTFDRALALVPTLVLICMLGWWWVRGRDPSRRVGVGPTVVSPEPISVLVTAYLCYEQVDVTHIVAELIRLARLGYVTVRESVGGSSDAGTCVFERADTDPPAGSFDARVLDILVPRSPVAASEVTKTASSGAPQNVTLNVLADEHRIHALVRSVVAQARADRYLFAEPGFVRIVVVTLGIVLAVVGFALVWYDPLDGVHVFRGAVAMFCGAVLVLGNRLLIPWTSQGVRVREQADAYRRFLDTSHPDGDALRSALDKSSHVRDVHLPYAIMFGVERGWLGLFAGFVTEVPVWFHPLERVDDVPRTSWEQDIMYWVEYIRPSLRDREL